MIPPTYDSHGESIPWEAFEPKTSNGGAIVLAFGSDGMSPRWGKMIRDHAQALAAEGFLALIPDYFRKGTDVPHGDSATVFGLIPSRYNDWQIALEDAVAAAMGSGINSKRVGFLGYSLGGFLCLRARRLAPVLVEFFAPYEFPTIGSGTPVLSGLGKGANSTLKAQIHHGAVDELVPFKHALSIESDLKAEGATVTLVKHVGAGHGFDGNSPGDPKALAAASKATIEFFKDNLK